MAQNQIPAEITNQPMVSSVKKDKIIKYLFTTGRTSITVDMNGYNSATIVVANHFLNTKLLIQQSADNLSYSSVQPDTTQNLSTNLSVSTASPFSAPIGQNIYKIAKNGRFLRVQSSTTTLSSPTKVLIILSAENHFKRQNIIQIPNADSWTYTGSLTGITRTVICADVSPAFVNVLLSFDLKNTGATTSLFQIRSNTVAGGSPVVRWQRTLKPDEVATVISLTPGISSTNQRIFEIYSTADTTYEFNAQGLVTIA